MENIYENSRNFAQEFVEPNTIKADINGTFPDKSFESLKKDGYLGLLVPIEYGGFGSGLEDHAKVVLALGESCPTTALCYMMHNVATMCIVRYGSKEMKEEILPKIAKGEAVLALAYGESGMGVHFYKPEIKLSKDDDKFVLNGRKSFVTTSTMADYYLVLSPSLNMDGLDNWLVSKDLDGISFEESNWDGLGMRGNISTPMNLDNVTIDEKYRIGEEGTGKVQAFETVAPFFALGLASVYTGISIKCCDLIVEYAQSREYSCGQKLSNIETVQISLADIYSKTQSTKHLLFAAAKAGANGDEDAMPQILSSRIHSSTTSIDVCTTAMKIGGGTAYAKRLPIERLLRDALASQVMAPSKDVLTIWLGRKLTNQPLI